MRAGLIVLGIIIGGLGLLNVTQITIGAAGLVSGALFFAAGLLVGWVEDQVEDKIEDGKERVERLCSNIERVATAIELQRAQLESILAELQANDLEQAERAGRMEKLAERQIQLLEWVGEINGEALRAAKHGAQT